MTEPGYSVLIADADPTVRRTLSSELCAMGLNVFEAADGGSALRTLQENDIRVVVCELYLEAAGERDLITAIRGNKSLKRTRTVVHTRFLKSTDRDWARKAGADAYLIRPVLSARLRDVVGRVATAQPTRKPTARGHVRPSLDAALREIENGNDKKTRSIIVSAGWWNGLSRADQLPFRKRAKQAGVRMLTNARLIDGGVELRARRPRDSGPYLGATPTPKS